MNDRVNEWNKSYENRDNFVFYPHEEVIRFVAKHIRKRVGLNELLKVDKRERLKVLDIGCGIGRHLIFTEDMGLEAYGIDLSTIAIQTARDWALQEGKIELTNRISVGNIESLPYESKYFDYAISHGVLDSVEFGVAQIAVKEANRVLQIGGLFYCDLISGDDSEHFREYRGEEVVSSRHEFGTIQSYFNHEKILELINGYFELVEGYLIKKENVFSGGFHSRYHLILRRI